MKRVTVLIDGFNLYHALDDNPKLTSFKWLNVAALARSFLHTNESLVDACFFTTIPTWDPVKEKNLRTYLKALETIGTRSIFGEFHKKIIRCKKCGEFFEKYEEKQTDVNIAVELLRQAQADAFDTVIVLSGDSDLIAAIRLVRGTYPQKKVAIAIPPGRRAEQLKSVAHFHLKIRTEQIQNNQFPTIIDLPEGHRIISPYQ